MKNFSTINSKGEVSIPKELRDKYRIKVGAKALFTEKKGELIIRILNKEYFESVAGILKGKGNLLAELKREKLIEREL